MEFLMRFNPPTATAQEHKVMVKGGRPVFYDPPEVRAAKESLMGYLTPHRPEHPMTGPLYLQTVWMWESDKAEPTWRTTKPDTDNLQKALKDCMTKLGYWEDDAQVVWETAQKIYVPDGAGIYVRIDQLDNRLIGAEAKL